MPSLTVRSLVVSAAWGGSGRRVSVLQSVAEGLGSQAFTTFFLLVTEENQDSSFTPSDPCTSQKCRLIEHKECFKHSPL